MMLALWKRVLSKLDRKKIKRYGLRVVEPHHDGTPHWHMLVWTETEEAALALVEIIREYWLSEDGNERGAKETRVDVKRMEAGGAAGYVAKNVGHIALAEHLMWCRAKRFRCVRVWITLTSPNPRTTARWPPSAAWMYGLTWGIRQFQAFGTPSVTVWRELRRVSKDQPQQLDLFCP